MTRVDPWTSMNYYYKFNNNENDYKNGLRILWLPHSPHALIFGACGNIKVLMRVTVGGGNNRGREKKVVPP